MRAAGLFLLMLSLLFPPAAVGGNAAKKVKQGIAHFRAQDFKKAANAFTEADVAKPDNDLISFDRACAYAAQGDSEKAAELFRAAALSRDTHLAARSYYNLGGLVAAEARALFGQKPAEATPDNRVEGLRLLQTAVGHYRNCIELAPDHPEARYNLELIRLWIKQMEDLWQQRDRQKQRDEMNLLEFLRMIETRQRTLRATARSLAGQPDSPQRRQAFSATSTAQRELGQEIDPLKEKISAGRQPAQPPPDESIAEAVAMLTQLADDVGRTMQDAARNLNGDSVDKAVGLQADAVAGLDRIYLGVVPFPQMVTRGVTTQEELVNRVAPGLEPGHEAIDEETENDQTAADPDGIEPDALDAPEAAWDQRFVAGWGAILPAKAEHGMKNLDTMDPAAMAGPAAQAPQQPTPDPAAAQKQQEQLAQLKAAMRRAVELGPQIHALAQRAADHLEEAEPAQALPKQQEALKLWKEIADLLPKQEQQEQCDNPNQDENQDDQQERKDQEQKDQEQKDDSQQQQPSPQDVSKQQAESVLRKARDQEKKRRDLEKEVQRHLFRAHAVKRDW